MACYPRIAELRRSANLSPEALADTLGIHKAAYVCYERGICDPPLDFLYNLSTFYNLSSDYIVGLINTPVPLKDNAPLHKPGEVGSRQAISCTLGEPRTMR